MGSRSSSSIDRPGPPGFRPSRRLDRPIRTPEHLVFTCYGGTHSSVVAAALYLGRLPRTGGIRAEQILQLPWFDRVNASSWGIPQPMGEDAQGRWVYALGRGGQPQPVAQALASGWVWGGGDPSRLWFIDTVPALSPAMRVGGFLSRRCHWVGVGRPLLLWSTQRAYARFVALVVSLQEELLGESATAGGPPPQRLEWRLAQWAGALWCSPRFRR